MNRLGKGAFALRESRRIPLHLASLAVGIIIMFIAGCEEQSLSSVRKSKLIADENRQLNEQLELNKKHISEQKELLNKCLEEKTAAEEKSKEDIEASMGEFMKILGGENKKLVEENEELKAQIKQLEEELEKAQRPTGPKPL